METRLVVSYVAGFPKYDQIERREVVDGEVVMARLQDKIRKARDNQG